MATANKQQISAWLPLSLGLGALGVAGGILLGAAAYATTQLNRRTPHAYLSEYTFTPFETRVDDYEEVVIKTDDGLRLYGWWLPQPHSQQVVIGLTGHRGTKADLLGIGSALWRAGNNVLLFDWRSRGQSDIGQHSLAYYELRDARAALRYVYEGLPAAQIGLIGYSMGASVAILLAAQAPEVRAVVADSPFTGVSEVVAHGAARRHLPPGPVVILADALTHWAYGYRFGAVRPVEAVRQLSPRPLLLIHGSADSLIPVQHAYDVFDAAGQPKHLWIFEGAEHCGGYFADRQAYISRVAAFFEQYLGSVG